MNSSQVSDNCPEPVLVKVPGGQNHRQGKAALLQSIMDSPQDIIIFALDRAYRYTEFTPSHQATIQKIWGREIAIGMNLLEVIGEPADREKAKANFDRALRGEHLLIVEEYGDRSHRRWFYENRYSPIFNATGGIVGVSVFVIDISERKQAEEAVRASQQLIEGIMNTMPVRVF